MSVSPSYSPSPFLYTNWESMQYPKDKILLWDISLKISYKYITLCCILSLQSTQPKVCMILSFLISEDLIMTVFTWPLYSPFPVKFLGEFMNLSSQYTLKYLLQRKCNFITQEIFKLEIKGRYYHNSEVVNKVHPEFKEA